MNSCYRAYIDSIEDNIYNVIKQNNISIKPTKHNIKIIIKYIFYNLPEHLKIADLGMKLDYISRLDENILFQFINSIKNIDEVESYFISRKEIVEKRLTTPRNPIIKEYQGTKKINIDKCNEFITEFDLILKDMRTTKRRIYKEIKEMVIETNIQ